MRMTPAPTFLMAAMLAGCGASSRSAIPDDRPPDLPPSVTTAGTSTEIRLSNPDAGVTRELAVAPDRAWAALLEVYQDFDFEADVVDERGRQLAVERLTRTQLAGERSESLARCANEGAGPSAASRFRITFSFVSRVTPDAGGSIVHTRVLASARPVDGSSIGQVACVSTGRLERRIQDGVALKLGFVPRSK